MLSTTPLATNSRASSAQSHCDRLRPSLSGLSHASLTRCTATSGGEKRLPSPPGLVRQARDSKLGEAPEPLVDNAALIINNKPDVGDGQPLCSKKNHLPATCERCRDQRAALPALQLVLLVEAQQDDQRGSATTRHGNTLSTGCNLQIGSRPGPGVLGRPKDSS